MPGHCSSTRNDSINCVPGCSPTNQGRTNMMRIWLAGVAAVALVVAGCGSSSPTSPGFSVQTLQGAWTSSSTSNAPNACTNFNWTAVNISGNSASGTFSAVCLGTLNVNGSATAALASPTSIVWAANGTATPPPNGLPGCAFSLGGTVTLENNNSQLRIPYSGTTCLGSVSGVEVLK